MSHVVVVVWFISRALKCESDQYVFMEAPFGFLCHSAIKFFPTKFTVPVSSTKKWRFF